MKLRYRFLMFAIGIMEGNPGRKFSESSADFGHFLSAKEAKKLLRFGPSSIKKHVATSLLQLHFLEKMNFFYAHNFQ